MKIFPSDIELVLKLQKGDIESFDLTYEKYASRLYHFALKYLKSKEETEELIQSVFLKVWENRQTLKTDTSFKSYLFTISYNEMCNLFRRRMHQKKFGEQLITQSIATSDTEDTIDYHSVNEQIEKIISCLPERQKIIFCKSRKEGKSTKEIALELGLSPGTVDNYISESLKFIRSNLTNKNFSALLFFSLFFSS